MRIYLCRVSERDDHTLYIERNTQASIEDDYIAISHVWGTPDAIQSVEVNGMDDPVTLSPGKISILEILHRPDVCGASWFWMDLFCLDQSVNARVSMADQLASIPAVYRSSRCVKVLIESPICRVWAELAGKVAKNPEIDIATFEDNELMHARKCRYMLFADPWFDRLWTRQEGLYATKIQVVLLDQRACPRPDVHYYQGEKWKFTGMSATQRDLVKTFLNDKLQYHGHVTTTASMRFQVYLDLVYRGELNMANYEPFLTDEEASYSPIDSAWRSGRTTTKARDYILAVFPDIVGYKVPASARSMSFSHLLQDALQQLPALQLSDVLAVKVSNSMVEHESHVNGLLQPYAVRSPSSATEAYDTFSMVPQGVNGYSRKHASRGHTLYKSTEPLKIVAHGLDLQVVRFTRTYLPELLRLWESAADVSNQLLSCPPSSPCFGSSRTIQDYEDMHYRAFSSQFCKSSIEKWAADRPGLIAHGIVDLEKMTQVTDADFELYLTRFMVCLLCGTTRANAMTILEASELRFVSTPHGQKLLALINKRCLQTMESSKFVLCSRGLTKFEGLHISVQLEHDGLAQIVGRTWIPKDGCIEEM